MVIEPISLAITLAIGLAIGALVGWLVGRSAEARLRAELDKDRAVHAERLKAYEEAEGSLREAFQALSAEALKTNNQAFPRSRGDAAAREARTEATADIDARKKAIEELCSRRWRRRWTRWTARSKSPSAAALETSAQLMQRIASLDTTGQDLRSQTGAPRRRAQAARRPRPLGRAAAEARRRARRHGGALRLRRAAHDPRPTNRRMRPDVIVRLPGGKHVVIDAKAPLDAYLKALEAPDEAARQALLADHAKQVRTHLSQLASKGLRRARPAQPRFRRDVPAGRDVLQRGARAGSVAHRVRRRAARHPGEPDDADCAAAGGGVRLAAAGDGGERAEDQRARPQPVRIGARARRPFRRRSGSRLKSSLDAYNQAVGSLEGNVLVKARKFKELQAANGGEEIKALEPIDRVPRMLQAPELTDGLPFPIPRCRNRRSRRSPKSKLKPRPKPSGTTITVYVVYLRNPRATARPATTSA